MKVAIIVKDWPTFLSRCLLWIPVAVEGKKKVPRFAELSPIEFAAMFEYWPCSIEIVVACLSWYFAGPTILDSVRLCSWH